jgi:hypothetical protein
MAFYILVSILCVGAAWLVSRSGVMRAWVRGHGRDPRSAGNIRDDEIGRTATWKEDGRHS